MSALRIVVDRLADWRPYYPSDDLISAADYLAQEANGTQDGATQVINLCGGLDYLGTGYYVSLLAQARGQRVLPSVETLNQLSRKALVDLQLESLAPLMDELSRRGALPGEAFTLRVMFGECLDEGLGRLARRLFERLPCPLMEARFQRRQGLWRLTRLKPLALSALREAEQDRFAQALNRHSRKVWRTPKARRRYRDDLKRLPEKAAGLQFPMVLKVPDGAFSRGVVKIQSAEALQQEASRLFESSALLLLQEWLPTDYDWRIGVLDGQVLYASRYYMARGHWQIYDHSRGKTRSGGFTTHAPDDVPKPVIKAALKATRLIGNGLYGVDIKQLGERVVVIEINDNPNLDAGVEDEVLGPRLYDKVMEVFLERMEANRRHPH